MPRRRVVSVHRVINAPPAAIFDLLADPRQHVVLDGSGSLVGLKEGPQRLSLGATFTMSMKLGVPYAVRNTVTVFEENHSIAWHHFAPNVWRYDLEEVAGGTRVTESFTFDNATSWFVRLTRFPSRNLRGMRATLDRLADAVSG